MRKRTLMPIVLLSLSPAAGVHYAASEGAEALTEQLPRVAATTGAASTPRAGDVWVRSAQHGARFDGRVHIDASSHRLGFDFRLNPPNEGSLWARVWFGEREEKGCTREVVLQGTSRHTSSWSVHEADGTPISIAANYSENAAGIHRVRFQLDRPKLPDGCAAAEWWEGNETGPTKRVVKGNSNRLFRLTSPPLATSPRQLSLTWGETSISTLTVREYVWAPSILQELSLSLGRTHFQPTVVSAKSEPIALWDFWRDGPAQIDLPVTPTKPWGTHAYLNLTTAARGTVIVDLIRLWIRHASPTDWIGSRSGARLWRPRTNLYGHPFQPTMTFVDDEWVHLAANSVRYQSPTCAAVSDKWNEGCHRYWYDADTGRLQIDDLQARVTERGWWWQGSNWDESYRVRTLQPGATRHYHGTGDTLPCADVNRTGCSRFAQAEVWLSKDGSYRWIRGSRDERGHYESLADSRLRLDRGTPGGKTKTLPLGIFGRVIDGNWRVLRFRLGNTVTRPESLSRTDE